MTNSIEQWEAVLELNREIERAARNIQNDWPGVVEDWEDLAGDIQLRLVEKSQAITLQGMEVRTQKKILKKIARAIVVQMRDDYEIFSGNFVYSTDEVRSLLERGAVVAAVQEVVDRHGNESTEWMDTSRSWSDLTAKRSVRTSVESVDVKVAFQSLEPHHQRVIIQRFVLGQRVSDFKAVTRAVDQLTKSVNRGRRKRAAEYEGPGSRAIVSNATSRLMTEDDG